MGPSHSSRFMSMTIRRRCYPRRRPSHGSRNRIDVANNSLREGAAPVEPCLADDHWIRTPRQGDRCWPDRHGLRRPKLLRLSGRLLSQAAALRAMRAARQVRLLLPEAAPLPALPHALLRPERLLPQALLPLSAALLAGLVHLRHAKLQAIPKLNRRAGVTTAVEQLHSSPRQTGQADLSIRLAGTVSQESLSRTSH